MKDTIRELYYWQVAQNHIKKDTEQHKEAVKELDKQHEKVKHALEIVYEDQALKIEDNWYSAFLSTQAEENIQIFKEGFYLGFDIAMALLERDK